MQVVLTEEERVRKQRELVETMGRLTNQGGGTSLAGRIVGLLSFLDKEEFTFEEIVDELKISKSSVSTTLNHLMETDKIEYITYPGDRKRYFRLKINTRKQFLQAMKRHIEKMEKLNRMALELKKDKESRTAKNISAMLEGLTFWKSQMENYEKEFLADEI
ncbi:MAG: ArsR family transcriptional regulator [Bacteroidales bacterium]|jgi:DNA-binding transcriptional regulator GbsR (MarR family)|nr:ArsR family transcriptional regulator [Bacteroidales bacterium]MBQ9213586.1 ArsR family transcriptional regulator [Bacteroidales bacterium]